MKFHTRGNTMRSVYFHKCFRSPDATKRVLQKCCSLAHFVWSQTEKMLTYTEQSYCTNNYQFR